MVMPPGEAGTYLVHFTGSADHNIRLRGIARDRGWSLSEKGFAPDRRGGPAARPGDAAELRTFPDEAAVYAFLGLPFIEPELREDRGEVEAAREGRLPTLITRADLRGRPPHPLRLERRRPPDRGHGRGLPRARLRVPGADRPLAEPRDRPRPRPGPRRAGARDHRRAQRPVRRRGGRRERSRGRQPRRLPAAPRLRARGPRRRPARLRGRPPRPLRPRRRVGPRRPPPAAGRADPADAQRDPEPARRRHRPPVGPDDPDPRRPRPRLGRGVRGGRGQRARRSRSTARPTASTSPPSARGARSRWAACCRSTRTRTGPRSSSTSAGATDQARRAWVEPANVLNTRPLDELLAWVAGKPDRV